MCKYEVSSQHHSVIIVLSEAEMYQNIARETVFHKEPSKEQNGSVLHLQMERQGPLI